MSWIGAGNTFTMHTGTTDRSVPVVSLHENLSMLDWNGARTDQVVQMMAGRGADRPFRPIRWRQEREQALFLPDV